MLDGQGRFWIEQVVDDGRMFELVLGRDTLTDVLPLDKAAAERLIALLRDFLRKHPGEEQQRVLNACTSGDFDDEGGAPCV